MGCSMAFQYSRNPKIRTEKIPGIPRGIPIPKNIRRSPAPSICAASKISLGIPANVFRRMNTGSVENIPGRITAARVSIRPTALSTR